MEIGKRILLVEDDECASELIYAYLSDCGFELTPVFMATDAVSWLRNERFDVVLLDINLPDFNGLEVLKSIQEHMSVPVIVTSAYGDTPLKLTAFRLGASDYMVKPLDMEELEARIWVQLRKHSQIRFERKREAVFKERDGAIYYRGTRIDLTAIEYEVFVYLLRKRDQAVSREELHEYAGLRSDRSLDNHIKNIRKKLAEVVDEERINTVYGVGYILKG
ncbi:response regulator transcription factor [Hydrogenimonas sp.]